MPLDIFGRLPPDFGGSFGADAAVVTFALGPGGPSVAGGVGLLTQSLAFQYTQEIKRIYEVGSRAVFYVQGRTQGDVEVERVLGPRPVLLAFYQAYGNICRAGQNVLLFQMVTGCNLPGDTGAGVAFAMLGVVLRSIAVSVRAEDMIVNEKLGMLYTALVI
jgi:hypothetical protein